MAVSNTLSVGHRHALRTTNSPEQMLGLNTFSHRAYDTA